jgi:hypothetical protein
MPFLNLKDLEQYLVDDSKSEGKQGIQLKNIQAFDESALSLPDLLELNKPKDLNNLPCSISRKVEVRSKMCELTWPLPREVYKGVHEDLDEEVRIEIFKSIEGKIKVGLKNQRKALYNAPSPFILKSIDNISTPWAEIWVSEFFSEQTLDSRIEDYLGRWGLVEQLFRKVMETLVFCHSHEIFMRFLNPQCILVLDENSDKMKLHGFVGASFQADGTIGVATEDDPFLAPEYGAQQGSDPSLMDAFSFAKCICYAMTGNPHDLPQKELVKDTKIIDALAKCSDKDLSTRKMGWDYLCSAFTNP